MIDLYKGDCLEVMKTIEDNSIDMVFCDLPYGTTDCKWDSVLPFDELWEQYNRVIKLNGAMVFTASEPFASALRMSNIKNYKYDWIWEKERPTNPQLANKQVLKYHEMILVFYNKQSDFFPIMRNRDEKNKRNNKPRKFKSGVINGGMPNSEGMNETGMNDLIKPKSVLKFNMERGLHPTQKPVPMIEYFIKTYTKDGMTILDNTMGSGSTMVACQNTNRNGIGIEQDETYFKIAQDRVKQNEYKLF
jgi:site-specific DNA-methyltransferase (adenine-specific)